MCRRRRGGNGNISFHNQKSLDSFAVSWFREIQNDLNVVLKGGNAGGGDVVAQEIQLGDGEHALLQEVKRRKSSCSSLYGLLKAEGSLDSGRTVAISENGSFANAQWNCVILAAVNIASMQSNRDWGESA